MTFAQTLGRKLIIADGAMGTQLQSAGLAAGEAPMIWNMTHPEEVGKVHSAYLAAGATFVTSNTFGANALNLDKTPYDVKEVVSAGIQIARQAVEQAGGEAYVALDISPLGSLLVPMGSIGFEEAVELFKEQIKHGAAAGADFVIIETMMDTYELKAAVLAAREACNLPVVATVAINEQGRLLNGADLSCVCALLEGLSVDALGINCGAGPEEVAEYFEKLKSIATTPLVLSPNAGMPEFENGRNVYRTMPQAFAEQMKPLVNGAVCIAGGCCGTTPDHIRALADTCKEVVPEVSTGMARRAVSSYLVTIDLDTNDPLIDYRIDPGTNSELADDFCKGSFASALDEVFDAIDDGAEILGVCALAPGVDEGKVLPGLVQAVQGVVKMPLSIVSADLAALEGALRIYNGCALVPVSHFPAEQREAAAKLASSYGAVIVER